MELNADKPLFFDLVETKEKELCFEIANEDNVPLSVSDVKISQLQSYLIADLKANESYHIMFGNSNALAPNYDLAAFMNKIPSNLPELHCLKVRELKLQKKTSASEKSTNNIAFMWICIGAGLLSLLYFSVKLLKEMK